MNAPPLLICLDLQRSFIEDGPLRAPGGSQALVECARLLSIARARRWDIVHCYLSRRVGPLYIPPSEARPIAGFEPRVSEVVLERAKLSAYGHGALGDLIDGAPQRSALVAGLSASLTFLATAFEAFERGHRFILAADALAAQRGQEADAAQHERVSRDIAAQLGFPAGARSSTAYAPAFISTEGQNHETIAKS